MAKFNAIKELTFRRAQDGILKVTERRTASGCTAAKVPSLRDNEAQSTGNNTPTTDEQGNNGIVRPRKVWHEDVPRRGLQEKQKQTRPEDPIQHGLEEDVGDEVLTKEENISLQRRGRIVNIQNGTFYDMHVSSTTSSATRKPVISNLTFSLQVPVSNFVGRPVHITPHLAIISPNPTPILEVLRGLHIATNPKARTFPWLATEYIKKKNPALCLPSNAIQYVGFNSTSSSGVRGAYLSARYESRREETDWTLEQYLRGEMELNASSELSQSVESSKLDRILKGLRIDHLRDMPVSNLSNGQTRRSRIAKALLQEPLMLLLDEPFMGLDPASLTALSPVLQDIAFRADPLLVPALRPQDPIPDWITHLAVFDANNQLIHHGRQVKVLLDMYIWSQLSRGAHINSVRNRAFAESWIRKHGQPPFDMVTILSKHGLRKFTAIADIWDLINVKSPDGLSAKWKSENADDLSVLPRAPSGLEIYHDVLAYLKQQWLQGPPEIVTTSKSPGSSMAEEKEHRLLGEPLVELQSIVVKYGSNIVLGSGPPQPGFTESGLNLTISRGTRVLIAGPNGSGKTTLLSLLTSDHPQSYSLPIKFFGRTRLPEPGTPGLSLWEIQSRIGYSSPEVHAFFPKNMTVRQVIESAWAETFQSKPQLTPERSAMVDRFLAFWKPELCQDDFEGWAIDKERHPLFGRLPFGTQRLLLLLRAIIKQPDIVILDEAFSGLPDSVRDKALKWLHWGNQETSPSSGEVYTGLSEQQALIVVSHDREEIPYGINQYIRLPGQDEVRNGKTAEMHFCEPGAVRTEEGWNRIWGF